MNAAARPRRQRGAALLVAMVILTLVATLAAGMVWQQWRAIEVESAERARAQAAWILNGAHDWARLILREDSRTPGVDHLGEPWAVPLAEARLSTFLAADRSNTTDEGPEAFLSGSIADAQASYNLRNLVDQEGKLDAKQLRVLERLCDSAGLPSGVATRLGEGLAEAWAMTDGNVPLPPARLADLRWLGLDAASIERLAPWVVLLPVPTPVNLNTAPREVIAAVVEGLDAGSAERLAQARERQPFRSIEQAKAQLGADSDVKFEGVAVATNFFEVRGRIRLGERVLEERSLVQRVNRDIVTLQRERVSLAARRP
ncbi:MAG: type II secretion system minor pseudopilin GspK [Burkholderiaceae bacterium]|nr:type II secretion system minor pseudopilin GspK [Burkholderiaceae bacterium]